MKRTRFAGMSVVAVLAFSMAITLVMAVSDNAFASDDSACRLTYTEDLPFHIPVVVNQQDASDLFSLTLQKVSDSPLAFSVVKEPVTQSHDCQPPQYSDGLLDIPFVEIHSSSGEVSHYSAMLNVDFDSNTATAIYHQRLDAVGVNTISINDKQVSASSLLRALGDYFGTPGLTFVTAYDLNNIAILVSDEGFFIVSKKEWMPPIIGFAGGQAIVNQQISENLVRLDKGIQQNIINNILPSAEEQEGNTKKWAYIFSQLTTRSKRGSYFNPFDTIEEQNYIGGNQYTGFKWGLSQNNVVDKILINKYVPSNYLVGCVPLAIARIMNFYQYPQGDVFSLGHQYTGLNKDTVTDDFARLVRDIGAGRATYTSSATGMDMTSNTLLPLFDLADYNATKLAEGDNSRTSISNLYIKVRDEINSKHPAFLGMWWNNFKCPSNTGYKCGHAVVVTGYKKIDPSGIGLEDLYIQIAMGWGDLDRWVLKLDTFTFWGSIFRFTTPNIPNYGDGDRFDYVLIGGITPKNNIKYKLTVNNSSNGTVISNSPFSIFNIYCGNGNTNCSFDFYKRSLVTLTATPKTGYKFTGWNGGGCSGTSSCVVTMDAAKNVTANFVAPPAAPEILSATAQTGRSIKISWSDKSNNEDGFKVYRYDWGKSVWVKIGSLSSNLTSHTDSGLTSGTTYYYAVTAYNNAGETIIAAYKSAKAKN